jgi:hypothetical protein
MCHAALPTDQALARVKGGLTHQNGANSQNLRIVLVHKARLGVVQVQSAAHST